jgi:hypothetical protein
MILENTIELGSLPDTLSMTDDQLADELVRLQIEGNTRRLGIVSYRVAEIAWSAFRTAEEAFDEHSGIDDPGTYSAPFYARHKRLIALPGVAEAFDEIEREAVREERDAYIDRHGYDWDEPYAV